MVNYYIDYENVHNEGLEGIEELSQEDKLYLFYSNKADTLKIDLVTAMLAFQGEIKFIKITNGIGNALDFQLITALMCNYADNERFYIISKDKGYDAAIEMAGNLERNKVYRCKTIEEAIRHQGNFGIDQSEQDIIVNLEVDAFDRNEELEENTADLDGENILLEENIAINKKAKGRTASKEKVIAEELKNVLVEEKSISSEAIADMAEDSIREEKTEYVEEKNIVADEMIEAEELARRANQSACTKLLNYFKSVHKINVTYKQVEIIYHAMEDTDGKMQFYHKLIQAQGKSKGGELYKIVKPVYKSFLKFYDELFGSSNNIKK